MFVIRFETTAKKGIFMGRYGEVIDYWTRKAITIVAHNHLEPHSKNANLNVRSYNDLIPLENMRFAFTPYFFMYNPRIARLLVRLTKRKGIVMRVISNPEIVWISSDGYQCCFIDKQPMSNSPKEEQGFSKLKKLFKGGK